VEAVKSRGVLARFFFGTEFNPRHHVVAAAAAAANGAGGSGGVVLDVKMFLYIAGAVNCQVLIVNYAASDIIAANNTLRCVVAVPLFCLTWFCLEYLYFEHIHLYTYDLFGMPPILRTVTTISREGGRGGWFDEAKTNVYRVSLVWLYVTSSSTKQKSSLFPTLRGIQLT